MEKKFLHQAIHLSEEKMQHKGGGPFGAVIVKAGKLIGVGWNKVTSSNDPTAHAEMEAIRDACRKTQQFSLAGCEIYSSCEPCPMCLAACYWARIERIYFAASQEDADAIGFDDARFYAQLDLPLDQRKVPMQQALRHEACEVMNKWYKRSERISY